MYFGETNNCMAMQEVNIWSKISYQEVGPLVENLGRSFAEPRLQCFTSQGVLHKDAQVIA